MGKIVISTNSRYPVNKKAIATFLGNKLEKAGIKGGVNVVLVGRRKMRKIAMAYKKENEALPVLAFPYHEDELFGEIFLCYPQVILLAAERNKTVNDTFIWLIEHAFDNLMRS